MARNKSAAVFVEKLAGDIPHYSFDLVTLFQTAQVVLFGMGAR